MGRRGPAPKPTALRVLHGDKPSRISRNEPQPRNLPPEKPATLTPGAAEEWDRILPDLVAMGTVKAADQAGLAAYCEAVALSARLSAVLAEDGPLVTGRDGTERRHPASTAWRAASAEVRAWAREFGFTPSARSQLRGSGPTGGPTDRLLSQRRAGMAAAAELESDVLRRRREAARLLRMAEALSGRAPPAVAAQAARAASDDLAMLAGLLHRLSVQAR